MKKILLITSVLIFVVFSIKAQQGSQINFEETVHDYGTIKKGENGEYIFKFKNTGNEPLIISECKSSCGCTVVEYEKQPIAPNKEGYIKVSYDTKRIGEFTKSVTVNSNSFKSPSLKLLIKGNVIVPDNNNKS